jgi:mannose-6-phosphate isomerase-like protein (cupin superfamily)
MSEVPEIIDEILVASEHLHIKRLTIPTGGQTPRHHHKQTKEIYYVLEGQGVLILGDERIVLKPHVCVEIPIHAQHQILNDQLLPLVVLSTKDQPFGLMDFHLDA